MMQHKAAQRNTKQNESKQQQNSSKTDVKETQVIGVAPDSFLIIQISPFFRKLRHLLALLMQRGRGAAAWGAASHLGRVLFGLVGEIVLGPFKDSLYGRLSSVSKWDSGQTNLPSKSSFLD